MLQHAAAFGHDHPWLIVSVVALTFIALVVGWRALRRSIGRRESAWLGDEGEETSGSDAETSPIESKEVSGVPMPKQAPAAERQPIDIKDLARHLEHDTRRAHGPINLDIFFDEEPTIRERLGPPDLKSAPDRDKPHGVIVWFATDRKRTESTVVSFSGERGRVTEPGSYLSYGTAYVTLPPGHVTGQIEKRRLWQIFADPNDARKFVVVEPPQLLSAARFFADVTLHVGGSTRKDVLVFVHGYNVTFDDGLKRLAQITLDLGFEGAPLMYSWPSEAQKLGYGSDTSNIEFTLPHLKQFLKDVVSRSGAERIYLIAHSLGNAALTRVLHDLRLSMGATPNRLFHHVILAAPDLDAEAFEAEALDITALARLVTLYASGEDRALEVSALPVVHRHPRAGQIDGLVVVPPMETIDATGIDSSFMKHSYFGETDPLLVDMHALLFTDAQAKDRFGLVHRDTDQRGRFWQFAPRPK